MLKVGLTGNFYSGYDNAANLFEHHNVPVFDADLVLKFMINYSEKVIKKIKGEFGQDIYLLGLLDMKKFQTNSDFDRLFKLIQLDLIKSYEKWRLKHTNSAYTIFKSSVLFERSLDTSMNFNISVFRPQNERKKDIQNLTTLPSMTIDTIISNEMDELTKNQKSDFVIHNYSSYFRDSINMGIVNQIITIDKAIRKKVVSNLSDQIKLSLSRQ